MVTGKWKDLPDLPEERFQCGLMTDKNDEFLYLFGGKIAIIRESNELWKIDPNTGKFSLVHDTLIEEFTKDELRRTKYLSYHFNLDNDDYYLNLNELGEYENYEISLPRYIEIIKP